MLFLIDRGTCLQEFRDMDGYKEWREKEAQELSDLVQRKLDHLQVDEGAGW
jgi:hypothetical protein